MECWSAFENITRLEFASKPQRLAMLVNLHNLREFKWRLCSLKYTYGYLAYFLDRVGPHLKKLELSHARVTFRDIKRCVNLEKLEITEHVVSVLMFTACFYNVHAYTFVHPLLRIHDLMRCECRAATSNLVTSST